MSKRKASTEMKVIPRFVYNPEKAERALSAMADILAGAIHRTCQGELKKAHLDDIR